MFLSMDSLGSLMIVFGLVLFGFVFLRLCSSRYFCSINVSIEFLFFFFWFLFVQLFARNWSMYMCFLVHCGIGTFKHAFQISYGLVCICSSSLFWLHSIWGIPTFMYTPFCMLWLDVYSSLLTMQCSALIPAPWMPLTGDLLHTCTSPVCTYIAYWFECLWPILAHQLVVQPYVYAQIQPCSTNLHTYSCLLLHVLVITPRAYWYIWSWLHTHATFVQVGYFLLLAWMVYCPYECALLWRLFARSVGSLLWPSAMYMLWSLCSDQYAWNDYFIVLFSSWLTCFAWISS